MTDPPKAGGVGLYADLLADPNKKSISGSTISSAPVRYNLKPVEPVEVAAAPKKKDASLQFKPNIKRPQPKVKSKPRPTFSASHGAPTTSPDPASDDARMNFWKGQGNNNNYVKPRPKWFKAKKNKRKHSEIAAPAWDEPYDPSQPNDYRLYKGSEEQYRDNSEWKDVIYHSVGDSGRGRSSGEQSHSANPAFALPSHDNQATNTTSPHTDHATGEDAFANRARLTADYNTGDARTGSLATATSGHVPPPPPPPSSAQATGVDAIRAAGLAKAAVMKAKLDALKSPAPGAPEAAPHGGLGFSSVAATSDADGSGPKAEEPGIGASSTISRAPVRYAVPETATNTQDIAIAATDEPPRVKKAGFGERMLEKQGWKKGQGLGADSQGITTAISVQAEKRKKRSDADGGGWEAPRNMGRIMGGKKQNTDSANEPGMSTVVKLPGMLHGLDVQYEVEQKNLQQELGDWFNENYGTVERVYIWRQDQGGSDEVFIKFTNAISALKSVNPVDVLTFANNEVKAQFFDAARFDNGDYE